MQDSVTVVLCKAKGNGLGVTIILDMTRTNECINTHGPRAILTRIKLSRIHFGFLTGITTVHARLLVVDSLFPWRGRIKRVLREQ